MVADAYSTRLIQRAYWLAHLRWLATAGVLLIAWTARTLFHVTIATKPILGVALLLVLHNGVTLWTLRRIDRSEATHRTGGVRALIHYQIAADLVLLTVLLHFSGGVENPMRVYFVFHMAIASSLLSPRASYAHATLGAGLLSVLAWSEYRGWLPHHCLQGFVLHDFHADGLHVTGSVAALVSMLYLVVYMTSDIAAKLRRREEAYREANEVLEQKDRIKDEYVARVTHDIKGHLAAIQSCHEVVVDELTDPLTDSQRNFIGRAHRRTETLSRFVRTLLELTEMRLSRHLEMGWFSLREVLISVAASAETRAERRNLKLTTSIAPTVGEVYGNFFSLEETVSNLVLNAIKYTPPGGQVELRAFPLPDGLRVEVCDTGIGIPVDERDRIFDEFFRASNARRAERDGTGLGLAIAKQILERHGGTLGADARPGGGSVFYFVLPSHRALGPSSRIDTVDSSSSPPQREDVHT